MSVLPMFPLGSVVLPGAVLPLHVFEPRYLRLVRDLVDSGEPEFGVTLIERGSEVGGGDVRTTVGTVVRLLQVAEVVGGRLLVVSVGVRRIRVNAWLPDDPYPLADVDDWPDATVPDDLPVISELVARCAPRARRAAALAVELGDPAGDTAAPLADDPVLASYQLAALAPIGPADAHDLLCVPGARARLERLEAMLDDVETLLRFRLADTD